MTERRKGIGGRRWKINLDQPKVIKRMGTCGHEHKNEPLWYNGDVCYGCYYEAKWQRKHADPRTPEQIALDELWQDEQATRQGDYPL